MTLTEMVQAHDGGEILPHDLAQEVNRRFAASDWDMKIFYDRLERALKNDLNAAWRLLAPGWEWGDFLIDDEGRRVAVAVRPKQAGRCVYPGTHKSLPCAMVLAALKTWEIE